MFATAVIQPTNPTPAPNRLLLLVLLLALLSGCRSERLAFQFRTEARTTVCAKADNQLTQSDSSATKLLPSSYVILDKPGKRSGALMRVYRSPNPIRVVASRPKLIAQHALPKNAFKQQLQASRVPKNTLADPDDSGYIIGYIILGLLGFSLIFIGIPLLIGAAFSLSYWTALLFWVGLIAAAVFIGLLPMIIDEISYQLMSEEKQIEKNKRDNEKYRNNQR